MGRKSLRQCKVHLSVGGYSDTHLADKSEKAVFFLLIIRHYCHKRKLGEMKTFTTLLIEKVQYCKDVNSPQIDL